GTWSPIGNRPQRTRPAGVKRLAQGRHLPWAGLWAWLPGFLPTFRACQLTIRGHDAMSSAILERGPSEKPSTTVVEGGGTITICLILGHFHLFPWVDFHRSEVGCWPPNSFLGQCHTG